MRVTAALPANVSIDVQYIYYQTSELEEIIGGDTKADYEPRRMIRTFLPFSLMTKTLTILTTETL